MDKEFADEIISNPANIRIGISRIAGIVLGPEAKEKIKELERVGEEIIKMPKESWEKPYQSLLEAGMTGMGISEGELKAYLGGGNLLGTLDEGARELGRITVEEGAFPENINEIAMTRTCLLRMGYEERLGQEISFLVYSGENTASNENMETRFQEKKYRLCGILTDYGGGWNSKGYDVASAIITDKAAEAYSWDPFYHVLTDVNGSVSDTIQIYGMPDKSMDTIHHFAYNYYSYDFFGTVDYSYLGMTLLIVFLGSAVVIFQMMGIQMKKRSRQVGLLKAIGATDKQVRAILLREMSTVIVRALPFGALAGFIIVPSVLWLSGIARILGLVFSLDIPLWCGGLLAGCLIAYIGAMIPIKKGSKIPIRGEIAPKIRRIKPLKKEKRYTGGKLTAGRDSGWFRVCVVILMTVMTFLVFFVLYQTGKKMIPYNNGERALTYELSFQGKYSGNNMNDTLLERIRKIPGVEAVYTGKDDLDSDLYLSFNGVENNELERLRKNWHSPPYSFHEDYKQRKGEALVNLKGIYTGWEQNMEGLEDWIEEGEFDKDLFESGQEIILFLPPYRDRDYHAMITGMDKVEINTDKRYRRFFELEQTVKPGDVVTLTVRAQEQDGNGNLTCSLEKKIQVKVGGILRYLPQDIKNPLWNNNLYYNQYHLKPYTVVAGGGLVDQLRQISVELEQKLKIQNLKDKKDAITSEVGEEIYQILLEEAISGESASSVNVKSEGTPYDSVKIVCNNSATQSTEGTIQNLSSLYGFLCNANYESFEVWKEEYNISLNRSILFMAGAVTGGFVFLCFLLQMVESHLSEDKRHFGIFQSLGIRRKDMLWSYFLRGLKNSILALSISQGFLFLWVWLSNRTIIGKISPYAFSGKTEKILYWYDTCFGTYNWFLHLLFCSCFLLIGIIIYLMPLGGVLKNSPVENIRELGE